MRFLNINSYLKSGEYRILAVLGKGGFGITYLAEQVLTGERVAIKEFCMEGFCERDTYSSQVFIASQGSYYLIDSYKQKFIKEAQIMSSLNHPNIVRVYDVFEENGTAYYVMEYLGNGSLLDMVSRKGALTEEEAFQYIYPIADALAYIHDKKILHLDVKPSNILLNGNGDAVLIDFGVSKHYDISGGQTTTTPTGISKGYAPLEQYQQGNISVFSPATDVYSLGATLLFLLTGNTPPEATEIYENGFPDVSDKIFNKSSFLAIKAAMEPRRKDRPQTVDDFLAYLGKAHNNFLNSRKFKQTRSSNNPNGQAVVGHSSLDSDRQNRQKKASRIGLWSALTLSLLVIVCVSVFQRNGSRGRDDSIQINGNTVLRVSFKPAGGNEEFFLTKSFLEDCVFSNLPDWCSIETLDYDSFVLTCDNNPTYDQRSTTIEFKKEGSSSPLAFMEVTQEGNKIVLSSESVIADDGLNDNSLYDGRITSLMDATIDDSGLDLWTDVETYEQSGQDLPSTYEEEYPWEGYEEDYEEDFEESMEEEAIPFQIVEKKPTFQGGDANDFSAWVNANLVYPEIARENGVQGRVTLQFTVCSDGYVRNVTVLRGVDSSLDAEAVRVVSKSPRWEPGTQRGRLVNVTYTFPVIFQLR